MKNRISLIIIMLFIGIGSTFAQFSFGFKLGGASTSLSGVELKDFVPEPKVKFLGGAIINYSFGRRIALQTEILYSGKGSAFQYYAENSIYRGHVTMDQKLGYFAVPFLLQFKMGDKQSYFHIDAGIVSNTLIHESFEGVILIVDDKGNEVEEDYTLSKSPTSHDLSYAFGIGLIANGLNFDFRMEYGTNTVFEQSEDSPEILNKSFQVSVGYTIRY